MKTSKITFFALLIILFVNCKEEGSNTSKNKIELLSPSELTVSSKGQSIEIELKENREFNISFAPLDASTWIKQVNNKSSTNKESLYFEIDANRTSSLRKASIIIKDKNNSGLTATKIKLTQKSSIVFSLKNTGWDIYSGENYRYGPSIIINYDGSINAWFAAVGDFHGSWNLLYNDKANKVALGITDKNSIGQKFTASNPFWAIKIISPNWSDSHCGYTLNLYSWNDSNLTYNEVVKQKSIAKKKFEDYKDNEIIGIENDDKFPAGTYLWVLSEGLTPHSGAWLSDGAIKNTTSFQNGVLLDNKNWNALWAEDKTSGDIFWDQASYQNSVDGGKNWSPEKMVLSPTEFSSDHLSICDPGVGFWNGYYYIGYTSTENKAMTQNNVFIARSKKPDGPWEKWDGETWGEDPKPLIKYDGDPSKFGAGEPSIVVVDNTVYFYYTWHDDYPTTRVATAPADDLNWPGKLSYKGIAINKENIAGADHCDVKYREDIGKFQAIHTAARMSEKGYIVVWQSNDGIHFEKIGEVHENLMPGIHNCGWSGDGKGHIEADVQQFLSYAYGIGTWGKWKTRWVEIDW